MKINLERLFLRANTHFVGNAGLGAVVGGLALHIVSDLFTRKVLQVPIAASVITSELDAAVYPLLGSGALAAYFGRPKTVAADPKPAAEPDAIRAIQQSIADRAAAATPVPSSAPASAASLVGADVPRPSQIFAAALLHVAGTAGGRSLVMATIQGKIADAIVSFYDANEPALLALITSKNISVVAWVENAAAALLAKNPMLALVLGGEVKSLAPTIIAFFGSEEAAAVAALDALLHAEATKLGG